MSYQVHLDVFHGPLDLLLYLVKRSELDLWNIPIARITEQYLDYLAVLHAVDVERAGEFVVMAGTLIELKSKVVLPRSESPTAEEEEEEDPRQELVKQLLEHKRFKDAAGLLEKQAERQGERHPRRPSPLPRRKSAVQLRPVEVWDLVLAFGRLLRETLSHEPQQIVADSTPIHVHMERIEALLRAKGPQPFSAIFAPPRTRARLVGIFLALLELTREFRVLAEQEGGFGEIVLGPHPGLKEIEESAEKKEKEMSASPFEPR